MTKYDTLFHQQLLNILLIKFNITVDNLFFELISPPESTVLIGKPQQAEGICKRREIFSFHNATVN